MPKNLLGQNIKQLRKKRRQDDFFPAARMWITTFLALFRGDKGTIPKDIGDRLYIGENMYISKNYVSAVIIEEFLDTLYLQIGALPENVNTWIRTEALTPFKVFDYFLSYLSADVRKVYSDIIDGVLVNFKTYLDKSGAGSDIFTSEYNIEEIIDTRVLTFDYGLLDKIRVIDPVVLEMKQLFAKLITDRFVQSNKEKKLHTVRILEESQMTSETQRRMYAEEMSLRLAQNQINIMLGNSIAALKNDKDSEIILDNINIWVLGRLTKRNMNYLIDEYSLDDYEEQMNEINKNSNLDRTFLVVNKLHRNTTSAMLKAFVPNVVVKGRIFKIVDSSEDEGV